MNDSKVGIVDDAEIIDLNKSDLVVESLLGNDPSKLDPAARLLVAEYKRYGLTPEEIHIRLYKRSIRLAEKNRLRGNRVK